MCSIASQENAAPHVRGHSVREVEHVVAHESTGVVAATNSAIQVCQPANIDSRCPTQFILENGDLWVQEVAIPVDLRWANPKGAELCA